MRFWAFALLALVACGDDDVVHDAGSVMDASVDAALDASLDAGVDAAADADFDAPLDAGDDAPLDAGGDAPLDAGGDADAEVACVLDPEVVEATSAADSSGTTECSGGISPWMPYRAAMSTARFSDGARCGTCLLVTGPSGAGLVLVDAVCGACADDDLDLSTDAALAILGSTEGRHEITWQEVPCEPSGNAFVDFQGTNPFYVKLRLTQTRNPVTSVRIEVGDGYEEASRTDDGFFELTPSMAVESTFGVRATDVFGATLEFDATIAANGVVSDIGAQFPMDCAP